MLIWYATVSESFMSWTNFWVLTTAIRCHEIICSYWMFGTRCVKVGSLVSNRLFRIQVCTWNMYLLVIMFYFMSPVSQKTILFSFSPISGIIKTLRTLQRSISTLLQAFIFYYSIRLADMAFFSFLHDGVSEFPKSNGFLIIEANGGLNQQRLSVCLLK